MMRAASVWNRCFPARLAGPRWAAWSGFWFTPADPTVLGVIRLCTGAVVLWMLVAYSPDLEEFLGEDAWYSRSHVNRLRDAEQGQPKPWQAWTWLPPAAPGDDAPFGPEEQEYFQEWGRNPRDVPVKGYPAFSIYFHVGDAGTIRLIHGGCLVIVLLFAVGFLTRITSVLTWLAVVGYAQRSPVSAFGVDAMASILLLYLMIGPSGAAVSVDRLLSRGAEVLWAHRRGIPVPPWAHPAPTVAANVAVRLIQVHLCIIYLFAGVAKFMGAMWWDHTVMWHVLVNPECHPYAIRPSTDMVRFLVHHRPLCEGLMTAATLFTLFTEIGFPFLVWRPSMRRVMLSCAVAMHVGIGAFMGLYSFGALMACMNLAFLEFGRRADGRGVAGYFSRTYTW